MWLCNDRCTCLRTCTHHMCSACLASPQALHDVGLLCLLVVRVAAGGLRTDVEVVEELARVTRVLRQLRGHVARCTRGRGVHRAGAESARMGGCGLSAARGAVDPTPRLFRFERVYMEGHPFYPSVTGSPFAHAWDLFWAHLSTSHMRPPGVQHHRGELQP